MDVKKKYNLIILALSMTAGLFVWFVESVEDYFLFNNGNLNFLELLYLKTGGYHLLITLLYIILIFTAASILSILLNKNKRLQKLLEHSARTLKTLKKINQIILHENDLKILIKKSCETLIDAGGFELVLFIDENGSLCTWAGLPSNKVLINDIKTYLSGRVLPECIKEAFINKKIVIKGNKQKECTDCSLNACSPKTSLAAIPLVFNENNYGILCALTDSRFLKNKDSSMLLEEVADDMALALHLMESESYRKEIEKKWSALIDTTTDGVISFDSKGTVTGWNPGAEKMTGYREDEIMGKSIKKIQPKELIDLNIAFIKNNFKSNCVQSYETEIITKSRKRIPVEATVTVQKDKSGKIKGMSGILRDITQRKKSEKILAETRERLELAMDAGEHGFWDWNLKTNKIYFSPGFFLMLDYRQDELPIEVETWFSLIHPDDKDEVIPQINEFISKAQPYEIEFRMLSKFRGWRWISSKVKTFETDNNDIPLRVIGVNIDITKQKKAEKTLKENKERLDLVIKGTNAGFWDWNITTGETFFNEKWAEIAGYQLKELKPYSIHTWNNLCHPEDLELSNKLLKRHFTGESDFYKCDLRIRHKTGKWVWVQSRGKIVARNNKNEPLRIAGTHMEITDKKEEQKIREQLEKQLRQSQKMEAVGKLAGGISQSFNKIINIIQDYSDLLVEMTDKDSTEHGFAKEISCGAKQASELTNQLLDFSRQQVLDQEILDLNSSVKKMLGNISKLLKSGISLKYIPSREKISIFADKNKLRQVLINLCLNAVDSMPEEGTITISTEKISFMEKIEAFPDEMEPGEYGVLSIEDTGCGIKQDLLGCIFDPLFTTKENRNAAGLGLSAAYGIVKQHKGYLRANSNTGKGSVFKLYFPLSKKFEDTLQEMSGM